MYPTPAKPEDRPELVLGKTKNKGRAGAWGVVIPYAGGCTFELLSSSSMAGDKCSVYVGECKY